MVGYIFWDSPDEMDLPRVQASYCPRRLEQPLEIVSTLQQFVQAAGGGRDAFVRLQRLRNRCWSFVDVSQPSWLARPVPSRPNAGSEVVPVRLRSAPHPS